MSNLSQLTLGALLARLIWLVPILGAAFSIPATAGPSVAQLLAACDRGAVKGNRGVDAALCEWYAAPCGCKPGPPGEPHWCPPATEPIEQIAARVVGQLRMLPDRTVDVDLAVPTILARIYPCPPAPER